MPFSAQVSLLAIRERELGLYSDNCRNIGAQAAILAGFAYLALTYQVIPASELCTVDKLAEGDDPQCNDPEESTVRALSLPWGKRA